MLPWLIGGGVFFLVVATIPHYGLTWDEPGYFYASDLETQWLVGFGRNLFDGKVSNSLQDNIIQAAWHWDAYHVPHPPFSRIFSGLTKVVFSPFIDKFTAYRLAPALLFALLAAVMYQWMSTVFDRTIGLFAALTLVVIPNLFGFAHFAVTDMPLTAMWFFTVYCFWKGLKDWQWSLVLGVVWGLALSTKFPAIAIPIPLLLWAHLYHRPFYANNLFSMIFLSPVVMVGAQPYLWHQTTRRVFEFLYDGLSRGYRLDTNFPIYFFDRLYLTNELPWYYPFFITGITLPESILALVCLGLLAMPWLKPQRSIMILFSLNAGFILVMGLLPGAVLHDGTRQLLPVLPFLAALAGGGFYCLSEFATEKSRRFAALQTIRRLPSKLSGILMFLALSLPTFDLLAFHPYELSYFNRLIGGVRGAYQRGLEVTYFMEVLNPSFLKHLNDHLPANAAINAFLSNFMLTYYQQDGRLREDIRIVDSMDVQYTILLNRRSTFAEGSHALVKSVRPHDAFRLDGVPLVLIYRIMEEPLQAFPPDNTKSEKKAKQ